MKILNTICVLMLTIGIFAGISSADERKKLLVVSDHWCPYACTPGDANPGYMVELVKKVFEIYDIDIEYKLLPWSTALNDLKENKVDVVIGVSLGEEREVLVPNVPQAYSFVTAFTRDDTNWVFDGIESLNDKRISVILDYVLGDSVKQFITSNYVKNPNLFVIESSDNAVMESIKDLLAKKTDVYVEDETVVNYYLSHYNIQHIRSAGRIDPNPSPLYIALSPTSPDAAEYLKMLEAGMRSLNATGDIKTLQAKYNIRAAVNRD